MRALNAVPGTGPLSLSADGKKFAAPPYASVSDFTGIGADKVKITAFGSDGKRVSGPMPLQLERGEDATILIAGVPGDVVLLPWKHKNRGPVAGKAKIAFVHSAKSLPPVEVLVDEKSFRDNLKFGIATDYKTLEPGKHLLQITYDKSLQPQIVEVKAPTVITKDAKGNVVSVAKPTPARTLVPRKQLVTMSQKVDLLAGHVYSVALFRSGADLPQVKVMEDKFTPATVRADAAK